MLASFVQVLYFVINLLKYRLLLDCIHGEKVYADDHRPKADPDVTATLTIPHNILFFFQESSFDSLLMQAIHENVTQHHLQLVHFS